MKKIFTFTLFILHFFCVPKAFAQADFIIDKTNNLNIDSVLVLPDSNYNLQQIITDTSLRFTKQKDIYIKNLNAYWVKFSILNPTPYDCSYALWCTPSFSNTLYAYNHITLQWVATNGGHMVSNYTSVFNYIPILCKSNAQTVYYINVNVTALKGNNYNVKTMVLLENLNVLQAKALQNYIWWLVAIFIVLGFMVYNAYLYFMFKERVYLYYLFLLFGGIIYITANNFYISLFTNFKILITNLHTDGNFNYLPTDMVIAMYAIAIIMLAMVQFTRHYLQTSLHLIFWDNVLKYAITTFVIYQCGYITLQCISWLKLNDFYNHGSNIFSLLLLLLMFFVGILAYLKKVKQAKYYLLAQALPLVAMIGLVLYLLVTNKSQSMVLKRLPIIAAVLQTLTFAIAVMARVNLIKANLNLKTNENQQMALQIEIDKQQNSYLEAKIEADKRDIAAAKQIKLLIKELHHRVKNNLQIVSSLLSLQSYRIKDPVAAKAVREGQYRIEAMSLIHQRLYITDNITEVNIKEYVTDLAESLMQANGYNKDSFVLNLIIQNEMMDVDKAIPLSLIINELVTNAFKYAYNDVTNPILTITLTKTQNNMQLYIADNGKGINMTEWENNNGYGKELIKTFTKQLDGEIIIHVDKGTMFKITFPNTLHNN